MLLNITVRKIVLKCGIPVVFLTNKIKEYNTSVHNFTVAIVD